MSNSSSPTTSILIVEDEVLVRMFAADALEDAGFKVEQATNGGEALDRMHAGGDVPGAVVIDLGLPDRPGDEIAAQIRGQHAELPILIASGRSEKELRERFAVDARTAIILKPYTGPMLIEALGGLGVAAQPA